MTDKAEQQTDATATTDGTFVTDTAGQDRADNYAGQQQPAVERELAEAEQAEGDADAPRDETPEQRRERTGTEF